MAILVTGGAGFIGSHTCVELLDAGYDVVVYDNLSNASEKSLERVEALTGKKVKFYKGDILDVLPPSGRSFEVCAKQIKNEYGEEKESAPHAMEKLYLKTDVEIPKGAYLRKKRN